ncbi:CARDB domain-containing protein [Streptomyces sp. NPDC059385]|uniref:CARDB domain-containing protein n=1 Tax=Streptomyces sp. NPDC059385 TaxID=3346817 RepID=UPI0036B57504
MPNSTRRSARRSTRSPVRQRLAAVAAALGLLLPGLWLAPGLPGPAHAADPPQVSFDVTVSLDWFERFEVPDSGLDEEGEFFPEVRIADHGLLHGRIVSDDAFHPNTIPNPWVFTERVTLAEGQTTFPVGIQIKDDDGGTNFAGDRMDISPQNQDIDLNLTYNALNDTWTGDSLSYGFIPPDPPCHDRQGNPQGQVCFVGDGDPNFPNTGDGKRAAVGVTITTSRHSDADEDGIADRYERFGVRNPDNSMAVDLPTLGANPLHKDVFLELDYSVGSAPTHEQVEVVRRAFEVAPLPNPEGGDGITLHVDSGGLWDKQAMEGPPKGTCTDGVDNDGKDGTDGAENNDCFFRDIGVEDFKANCSNGTDDDGDGKKDAEDPDCIVGEDLGGGNQIAFPLENCKLDTKYYDSKARNHQLLRKKVFNYVLYTTKDPDTDGSGPDTGCPAGVGGWGGGIDIVLYSPARAAGLMHELGHNLGLDHGGNEKHNCKPNYVSVMNYNLNTGVPRKGGGVIIDFSPARITMDGLPIGRPGDADYVPGRSGAPLDPLKEDDLHENRVLEPRDNVNEFVFKDGAGAMRTTPLNENPDWNGDNPKGFGDDGDARQIVNIDGAGPADCDNSTTSGPALTGHDDWSLVKAYMPRRFPQPGGAPPVEEDPPLPSDEEAARIQALNNTTDLALTMADAPDPVAAGERLTWTVGVTNNGPNSSTSTQVTTELPADVTDASTTGPCLVSGRTVTCNLNEVPQGASRQYTISAQVPPDLVYRNGGPKTVSATSTLTNRVGPDPRPADNTATAETRVIAKADVSITGTRATSPLEVLIGEPGSASLEVTVANAGPSTPIDTRLTTTGTADVGVTVTPATATVQQTALSVGTPQTATYTAQLACTSPGLKRVRLDSTLALKNAEDVDPNPANNTASTSFQIDCVVPIAINVRPGGFPNSINLNTDATLAALTTRAGEYNLPLPFSATAIDVAQTYWGLRERLFNTATPAGAREIHGRGHPEDSYELDERTRDRDTDLVMHFKPSESGLTLGSTRACLKGRYRATGGQVYTFLGCDSVRVVN